ncbi:MAG: hypothetical protein JO293_05070, partial [Candidatus Eremiobacteraeota bacterium]|nr:hypothetical protein [Candidatus Eremiobacteraeota bacterium]
MPVVCAFVPSCNAWEEVLDALDGASPLVEDGGPGVAFLEMRGIDGDARRWIASVRSALEGCAACSSLEFRVSLASNKFVALCAARSGDGTVVARGREAEFVAPLPLAALDLDPKIIERLRLFGVRTLGELAALPHGPFVRRFGPPSGLWHARANGVDETPLVPRPRALRIDRSLYGEGTAEYEEQVLFALRTL